MQAHSRAHLRIENSDLVGRNGTVTLNGQDISHQVQRVEVYWDADDVNRAIITLLVEELVVDGETLIYRPEQCPNEDTDG
jgi:hypothetical protein